MSEGLNENHIILGIHMIGNEMNTNALGFLYKGKGDTAASHILPNISKIHYKKGIIQQNHENKNSSN